MQLPTSYVAAEKPQDLARLSSVCIKHELFQALPTQPYSNKAKQCRFTCSQYCHEATVPRLCPHQCCQLNPSTPSVWLPESRAELSHLIIQGRKHQMPARNSYWFHHAGTTLQKPE